MSDSLIRLKQLNTREVSGFVDQILASLTLKRGYSFGGDVSPTNSGVYDMGSQAYAWDDIFCNAIHVAPNEGLWFGSNLMTASVTPSKATLTLGGYTFFSDGQGTMIIGPTGATGPSGARGATVTGVSRSANQMRFALNDGTFTNYVDMPSGVIGATGPSGVSGPTVSYSVVGYNETTGNYFQFVFTNGSTGQAIALPSGADGAQGTAGGILIDFEAITGIYKGQGAPKCTINGFDGQNPDLYFIKGMTYVINELGLDVTAIDIPGDVPDLGIISTNWFNTGVSAIPSGYMKFVMFPQGTTGTRYVPGEYVADPTVSVDWYSELTEDADTRGQQTVRIAYGASETYKWGFAKHNFTSLDQYVVADGDFGYWIMGDAHFSLFAPTTSGERGAQGIPGPAGLPGSSGPSGVGVVSVERLGNQIRFALSNSTYTAYIDMPTGGPSGVAGPIGPIGTGVQGIQGIQGPSGLRGDKYSTQFYPTQLDVGLSQPGFERATVSTGPWTVLTGTARTFTTGQYIRLTSSAAFGGMGYSVPQELIFGIENGTFDYFTTKVVAYDSVAGRLTMQVNYNDYSCGGCGGSFSYLQQGYAIDANLHTNGTVGPTGPSGATGAVGPTGIQGSKGADGNAWTFNNPISGLKLGNNVLQFTSGHSCINAYITGNGYTIDFDKNTFLVGENHLLRIANSGAGACPADAIGWNSSIRFPNNTTPPFPPLAGQSTIYTMIRFPDLPANTPMYFCTFATNYN